MLPDCRKTQQNFIRSWNFCSTFGILFHHWESNYFGVKELFVLSWRILTCAKIFGDVFSHVSKVDQKQTTCLHFQPVRPHGIVLIWQASDGHAKNGLSFIGPLHPVSWTAILCRKYVIVQYLRQQIIAFRILRIILAVKFPASTQFLQAQQVTPPYATSYNTLCSWLTIGHFSSV